jgi:hypothetical protein
MIVAWLVGGLALALLVIHMARPRFERRRLSAARFFEELPPAPPRRMQWRPGNPLRSLPLYPQMLVLLLLLAAVLSSQNACSREEQAAGIGLWLALDSSASMSTLQGGEDRLNIARRKAASALAKAEAAVAESDGYTCARLSTFDMEQRELGSSTPPTRLEPLLDLLAARPLGTDLSLVRVMLSQMEEQAVDTDCFLTHLVIVSDLPAPGWLSQEAADRPVIWLDVAEPVNNVGFTQFTSVRDPLTGLVYSVQVEISAYGPAPSATRLLVEAPDGSQLVDQTIAWEEREVWQELFEPQTAGLYTLTLIGAAEEAYKYDDQAVIEIGVGDLLRVNWQLPDTSLPVALGWQITEEAPDFQVLSYGNEPSGPVPTLIVGPGYQGRSQQAVPISDFYEPSPLLDSLNFDVVEQLALPAVDLPAGFEPVLRGEQNRVWLAQRAQPPAAYIPGLPLMAEDDNAAHFSTTVFFNAVRWLLQARPLPPLYYTTTPENQEVSGNRLALHEAEGNTAQPPSSYGSLVDIVPTTTVGRKAPLWPFLLALAAALFFIERSLAAYGGERWR